jgi:hypothetical protein
VSQLDDGTEKAYFMKTGSGKEAEVMFEGKPFVLRLFYGNKR